MTPKEKAEELFEKFNNPDTTHYPYVHNAQQCALIAVDEIMLSRKDDSQFDDTLWKDGSGMYTKHPMYLNYWQEVKQEIENL